ncbi:cysteine-rich RLK (RECEPTOR-like protein kinase) 25 [Hibiscus trionum]|uniref:Cysteine-rich RLK (RECEPTOR-like protein kinase) 25 n=1 Tax=Hibiscus trionum TaxID=183268 RepID=A0A9W7HBE3_HIBTR|nr:cysteine-rich RLK (RECEPTOR-like protein kinase) 25 [Hibiscus trionum]
MAKGFSWPFLSSSLTIITFLILTLAAAQQQPLYHFCLDTSRGNFSRNSTYETSLNRLLSSFSLNTSNESGFYNFSSGQGSNTAYAIALCRGDVNPTDCFGCINNANAELRTRCPNQREAIIWYDSCMFRYADRSIFGVEQNREGGPSFYMWNMNNVTNVDAFNQALDSLMYSLIDTASSGRTSLGKFATGSERVTDLQTVYALVQCTPDLTPVSCRSCLTQAIIFIPQCCDRKQGGRVYSPSCNFRFEIARFYNLTAADIDTPSAPAPAPSPPPSNDTTTTGNKSDSSRSRHAIIISISAVAFALLVLSSCIFIVLRLRKPKMIAQSEATEAVDGIKTAESLQYDFDTIRAATDNFTDAHKLGQGGFGAVYKGTLAGGKLIAVKRLSTDSGQGDREFENEVRLMANLQHRNLVRLQGFCIEGNERLLIYEFVPNGSLDKFLFDPVKKAYLNWESRFKIIGGIARGLLYLHHDSRLTIIHRDLKPSNILLDAEMTPKIADFGMARLCAADQTQGATSRIVGTYGYMAPEYAMQGQFSGKSDVFSFGVLVLEILSGRKSSGFHNGSNVEDLLSFAWRNWKAGTAFDLVDPGLRDGPRTELMRCIHIGLLCVQENVARRPNMGSVELMLTSYSATLPLPSEPTISEIMQRSQDLNSEATTPTRFGNETSVVSENGLSITELYPR